MPRWKCKSCGGTYSDELRGSTYFHACPPTKVLVDFGEPTPIVNPRNENISLGEQGEPIGIISHGAGVTPLDGQQEPEPLWIATIKPLVRL